MGLQNYPFVKLLIPFVTGIITENTFYEKGIATPTGLWLFLSFVSILSAFLLHHKIENYSRRWIKGIPIYLFLFSIGGFLTQQNYQKIVFTWPDQPQFYEALLLNTPKEHLHSYSCEAFITGYRSLHSPFSKLQDIHKKALIYLPKEIHKEALKPGKLLYLQAQITSPCNNGNPEEFDYRNYLLRKGISGTGYATRQVQSPVQIPTYNLHPSAEIIRQKLLQVYHSAGIHGETHHILSALTLGYKEELSSGTRIKFSNAGVSHLLALSGLHIGFVYLLLEFCTSRLFKNTKLHYLKPICMISALWLFAFLTGLMPPATRATLLFTFIIGARIYRRDMLSLNIMAASAFLMLFLQPLSLFDVSFQLSFAAVTGILLWQKSLFTLLPTSNCIIRYFWGLATLSLAAQLATLPFTLHYFSTFPNYFLIANMAVIGLVSVIIYSAFGLFLLTPFPSLLPWGGEIVKKEIHLLQKIVEWVGELPGAILSNLYVPWWEAASIALFIGGFLHFFTHRRTHYKVIFLLLTGIFCITASELTKSLRRQSPHPQIIFYSTPNCPSVHLIASKAESYLWTDSTSNGYPSFIRNLFPYWKKTGISFPQILSHQNEIFIGKGSQPKSILRFQDKTICQVKDKQWNNLCANHPLPVDYLWICKGYYGTIKKLQSVFSIRNVILDASLPLVYREQFEKECRILGLSCINLHTNGAYFVPPPEAPSAK